LLNSFVGAGFQTLDNDECVDEEIDIDGDDQAVYGEAQFTESDVVPVNRNQEMVDEDVEVDIEDETEEAQSLRDLLVDHKNPKTPTPTESESVKISRVDDGISEIDRLDVAIAYARQRGDKAGLVLALENKIQALVS